VIVDDWEHMTLDERRLLLLIFKESGVNSDGIGDLVSHDDWKPYLGAVLSRTRDYLSGRRGQTRGSDNSSAGSGRARMAAAVLLNPRGG
jgi:hypothetical protein